MASATNDSQPSYDGDYLTSSIGVYSLIAFPDTFIDEALELINHEIEGFTPARLAPDHYAPSQTLGTLMTKHAQLAAAQGRSGAGHEYHPTMFLILTSDTKTSDIGTCLAVSNDYDGGGTSGNFSILLQGAATQLMNIELGNSSWEETKDECEDEIGALAKELGQATIDESQGGGPPEGGYPSQPDQPSPEGNDAAQAQPPPPPSTTTQATPRYLAIYTLDASVRMPQLAEDLNGAVAFYGRRLEQQVCRLSPWMNFVVIQADAGNARNLEHIREIHRTYCGRFEGWHPDLAVVAEGTDFLERGVLIANFEVGEGSGGMVEDLATRRMGVGEVVGYFNAVVAGRRAWDQ